MMSTIFTSMVIIGFVLSALTGRMPQLSTAIMSEAQRAVELIFSLLGAYCLWGGLMQVAEDSGLSKVLAKAISPITRVLFRGLNPNGAAMKAVSMNLAANFLGLGNAATPLGIMAMREMQKEERSKNIATDNMALFVVMNTASLQLIPTTTAMLRTTAGSLNPLDILPAVWISSAVSVVVGISLAKFLSKLWR